MLIQANDNLIINPDAIVAARLEEGGAEPRWRCITIGHNADSPTIWLTESEMAKILAEVEAPKLAAILRAAGSTKPNRETHR